MIRFLLLHRIDETDQHPGLMFAGLAATIVLAGLLQGLLP